MKPINHFIESSENFLKHVNVELATSTYIYHRDNVRINQLNSYNKREEGK